MHIPGLCVPGAAAGAALGHPQSQLPQPEAKKALERNHSSFLCLKGFQGSWRGTFPKNTAKGNGFELEESRFRSDVGEKSLAGRV